mmetsp:Transcript_9272/g.28016  ORF Transcript_9272/g.28016 Transcript_9272/m.28016 type:complete len:227 (+) Transcript_9272:1-681(+)
MSCFLFCSASFLATLARTTRLFSSLIRFLMSSASSRSFLRNARYVSLSAFASSACLSATSAGVDTSMTSRSAMPSSRGVLLGSSGRPWCVKLVPARVSPSFEATECMRTCSRVRSRKATASSGPTSGRMVRVRSSPYRTRLASLACAWRSSSVSSSGVGADSGAAGASAASGAAVGETSLSAVSGSSEACVATSLSETLDSSESSRRAVGGTSPSVACSSDVGTKG